MCHIFSFKFLPQYFSADKKIPGRSSEFSVLCKSATGNDAVHMHMVTQFLVPSVKHLDDTGCCSEPLLVI